MAKVRLYKLARELEISSSRLIQLLAEELKIDLNSHLCTLETPVAEKVRRVVKRKMERGKPGGLVFVCYARADQDFVLELARNLRRRGVRVWVDQWEIKAGADYDHEIDQALDRCDQLLLVLSPKARNSREVRSEWRSVLDDDKPVIPLIYKRCKLPYRLSTINHIDLTSSGPDDTDGLDAILRSLRLTG